MFTRQVRFRSGQRILSGKSALAGLAGRKVGARYERGSAEEFEVGHIGQTGLTQTALSPALFFLGGGAFWGLQSKVLRTLLRE